MRLICGIAIGLAFAWTIHSQGEAESSQAFTGKGSKFQPYVPGFLLPMFLLLLVLFELAVYGAAHTGQTLLSICFSLFLHISVYYCILLPLLPLLRKRISSRACAILWLIPNYLYLMHLNSMAVNQPLLVITAPGKLVWILPAIWLIGFLGLLICKIGSHLRFRSCLLKDAEIYPDLQVRQQWKLTLAKYRTETKEIPLMVSNWITTPLTIGLFPSSTVVFLPDRTYSQEELELIFLHEIIHIQRGDPWNKFFLMFCTAMCWFNPLMWIAMSNSAEDLELSCDETVLLNKDVESRTRYAQLLLRTAGDGRGFTTCLSASAKALRYRLKNSISPIDRASGAKLVGITFLLLALSYGYVALAYGGAAGNEMIPQLDAQSGYTLTVLNSDLPISEEELAKVNTEQVREYFSGLTMYRITGQFTFQATNREALIQLQQPGTATYWMFIGDKSIELHALSAESNGPVYYYIPDGIDWNMLDSLINSAK